jgi:hypothetical protein
MDWVAQEEGAGCAVAAGVSLRGFASAALRDRETAKRRLGVHGGTRRAFAPRPR